MSRSRFLTPTEQAAAFAEWGGAGSFRCCSCGDEVTSTRPAVFPTGLGFGMAACRPCEARAAISPSFRRQAHQRADDALRRAILQRAADVLGVTGKAFMDALSVKGRGVDLNDTSTADAALSLPAGSVEGALRHVLRAGICQ